MNFKYVGLVLIAVLCASSVVGAKGKRRKRFDCSARVEKAIRRYEKGRFGEVKTILDEVRYQCGGHRVIDTVFYYLGMAHLRSKQAIEAKTEFERLIQNYPNSPFSEEAHFRLGHSSFLQSNRYDRDQTETKEAIRELTEFIETFAKSPFADSAEVYLTKCHDKLARKEFSSARFYHTIDQYDAAIIYYKTVIEEFPQSAYISESKLFMAQALAKVKRHTEAQAVIEELLSGNYNEEIKKRAGQLQSRLKGKKD